MRPLGGTHTTKIQIIQYYDGKKNHRCSAACVVPLGIHDIVCGLHQGRLGRLRRPLLTDGSGIRV